ncbi:heat shock protein DnaJ family protein [Cavenderia fasciculata]|uniref:Heat shock protein DnaJ family protein n=1 Tax=Cavenderia fasciculata TaxID=261658 RepID=F4Q4M9_CACFS|nr:heat shock protein DnaJ family protein [Cavenderia fasciculata]EGG17038.1 heat shock protein DnaJ family protein [Cavenderia fasciculata]|eukprot:XP_004355522.1 heat shock protein DnaJ family protein [Cavenderia fasciculata]
MNKVIVGGATNLYQKKLVSAVFTVTAPTLRSYTTATTKKSNNQQQQQQQQQTIKCTKCKAHNHHHHQSSSNYLFNNNNNNNENNKRFFRSTSPQLEEKRDLYEVLDVPKSATKQDIKKAFYALAKKYHPDTNQGDPNAHKRFSEITNAYDVLSDENKRAMYDAQGHQGATADYGDFNPNSHQNMEEMFQNFDLGDLFGQGFGGQAGGKVNGSDIQIKLHLDFMDAVNGCNKDVSFHGASSCSTCDGSGAKPGTKATNCKPCHGTGTTTKSNGFFAFQSTCKTCKGTGKQIKDPCGTCRGKGSTQGTRTLNIKIPQGVNNGMNIKLTGQGEPGERGGRKGNLYVNVSVGQHELFRREGNDIHLDVPITLAQAILGSTVTIPTLSGEVDLKVTPGTQPGEKRVLRNKGVRSVNDASYGNQYVHFVVTIPKNVNDKQKQLIQEFDQEEKNRNGPLDSLTHPILSIWNSAMKRWREYSKGQK